MSILVALGDDVEARLAAYLLTSLDKDIVIVETVDDVERRIREDQWSAIVLDTALPDGTGFTVLNTLAQIGYDGAVLVLSAARGWATRVRALEEGADDFLVRPYEPAELLARMKALMRRVKRTTKADVSAIRVGAVELDTHALEVALPGRRRVRLTPNEMRLLHYLMTHARRVVEHAELATHVFGSAEQTSSSNAVGVYMRRVRRKIEDDVEHPRYIVTVRGSGYRFNALPEQ